MDTLKAAAHGKPRSFSAPRDPIAETLHAAHLELKTNGTRNFEDFYKLDKIIGHGAFAKVSICTSLATQQQYAVKAVQKNKEDLTGKQREGRSSILRRQGEKCRGSDFDFRHSSDILPTPPPLAYIRTRAHARTHIHSRKYSLTQTKACTRVCTHAHIAHTSTDTFVHTTFTHVHETCSVSLAHTYAHNTRHAHRHAHPFVHMHAQRINASFRTRSSSAHACMYACTYSRTHAYTHAYAHTHACAHTYTHSLSRVCSCLSETEIGFPSRREFRMRCQQIEHEDITEDVICKQKMLMRYCLVRLQLSRGQWRSAAGIYMPCASPYASACLLGMWAQACLSQL